MLIPRNIRDKNMENKSRANRIQSGDSLKGFGFNSVKFDAKLFGAIFV